MRNSCGQMAIALNLVIAIFVVGSLGLVAYELSRILLAREQLKHCLELAALSGGAEMASTNDTGQTARNDACTVAMNILKMNSILGQPLTNSAVAVPSLSSLSPTPGQVQVYFEFDDPITKQPAPLGQQANVMRVYGAYAYPLFSGGFGAIAVAVYTLLADATAGLPAMDLMIVYDHDSSVDDQTPVTFVRRYWDNTVPAIAYHIPGGPPLEEGTIWAMVCPPSIGSAVNALPPQNLDAAGDPKVSTCPKEFSEVGTTGKTVPLRGVTNTNGPPGDAPPPWGGLGPGGLGPGPGNTSDSYAFLPRRYGPLPAPEWLRGVATRLSQLHFEQPAYATFTNGPDWGTDAYNPWQADPTMFTDMVVNLDGNQPFAGYTDPGVFNAFPFPDLSYLVEASRGSMDNWWTAPNTHTDNAIAGATKLGYQQAYQCLAYRQMQPKRTVENALQAFMQKLTQTSDCHFGFVAFNNRAGLNQTDTDSAQSVSWAYPPGTVCKYLIPQIPLSTLQSNFNEINVLLTPPTSNATPLFTPDGGSNLADGLQQAMNNLTGPGTRTGAFKAIVVFTDKVPTRDLKGNVYINPAANAPALNDALTVAATAKTQGIPIFMVTLDQSGGVMAPYLQTQFSDTAAGGLVNTAGNGGTLYIDTWVSPATTYNTLVGKFNNVVRQLMTLVQG